MTDFHYPYAYGEPSAGGVLRRSYADFLVDEQLGFTPSGEGEHVFLHIEKAGLNTQQLADKLASFAKVPVRQVSYAGMKDRNAITRQWFSVHQPGVAELDWTLLNNEQLTVVEQLRHGKKLRRGAHRANRFVIRIQDVVGDSDALQRRAAQIAATGIPNYFGEQRFGRNASNINQARQWFEGSFKPKKHRRGIYLSAARALLFNQVLAARVADGSWNQLLEGELAMLDGSNSVFAVKHEADNKQRVETGDIHPTGLMAGRPTALMPTGTVERLEQQFIAAEPLLQSGLEQAGLNAERRALRVLPGEFTMRWSPELAEATLSFVLPRGCYATALLRELLNYSVSDSPNSISNNTINNNNGDTGTSRAEMQASRSSQ